MESFQTSLQTPAQTKHYVHTSSAHICTHACSCMGILSVEWLCAGGVNSSDALIRKSCKPWFGVLSNKFASTSRNQTLCTRIFCPHMYIHMRAILWAFYLWNDCALAVWTLPTRWPEKGASLDLESVVTSLQGNAHSSKAKHTHKDPGKRGSTHIIPLVEAPCQECVYLYEYTCLHVACPEPDHQQRVTKLSAVSVAFCWYCLSVLETYVPIHICVCFACFSFFIYVIIYVHIQMYVKCMCILSVFWLLILSGTSFKMVPKNGAF